MRYKIKYLINKLINLFIIFIFSLIKVNLDKINYNIIIATKIYCSLSILNKQIQITKYFYSRKLILIIK